MQKKQETHTFLEFLKVGCPVLGADFDNEIDHAPFRLMEPMKRGSRIMPGCVRKDIVTADEVSMHQSMARCVRRAHLCGEDLAIWVSHNFGKTGTPSPQGKHIQEHKSSLNLE